MLPTFDPFSHNSVLYRGAQTQLEQDDPSFFDVVGASMGYTYDPIIETISNAIEFRGQEDVNYRPLDDIQGYEFYRDDLMDAKNAAHMVELKRGIDENIARREILSKATFGQHFFAGLADPVNLVALPFGGAGIGLARSFLRTGTSVAALQAGQEVIRAPFDPLGTKTEIALNIGSAFVAGGLLGTAIAVPATRRANAFVKTKEALKGRELIHEPDVNTKLPVPTANRPLSQVEAYEVDTVVANAPRVINALEEVVDDLKVSLQKAQDEFDAAKTPDAIKESDVKLKDAQKKFDESNNDLKQRKDEYKLFKDEFDARQLDEKAIASMDDPYGLPKNLWTDSFAYKFVTTPMKRVLQSSETPDSVKKVILAVAGDSGIALNLHFKGFRTGPSVYQKASMRDGEWVKVYDELRNIYGSEFGKGKQTVLDYDVGAITQKIAEKAKVEPKNINFQDYITEVNKMRMRGDKPRTDAESRAMKILDDFYENWEGRLSSTGLIGSVPHYTNRVMILDGKIAQRQDIIKELEAKASPTELDTIRLLHNKKILGRLKSQKEDAELQIQSMKDQRLMPANEEKFHPRYWNKELVESKRGELHQILTEWYKSNPFVYVFNKTTNVYDRVKLSPRTASKRANDTIDKILNLEDVTAETNAFYGYGRSKHFRHREVDIPNKLVMDFIETNPVAVMKAYTAKIAPQYELQVKFGQSIDDVLEEAEDDMLAAGMSQLKVNRNLRDIRHLNDRVQGTVIRNPDAMSLKAAIVLKDLAMLNYLGSAGFATLPDFAKVMMEHEMGTVFKMLFGVMKDNRVRMTAEEGRLAGEIIDILKGDAHMRFSENMSNNPLNDGLLSKVRTGFFMLNGVAPMTTIFKKMDAIARGHTLIDYSIKLTRGQASDMEVAYLARYNIGKQEASEIANAPWDKTDGGLYLPNTKEWTTGRQESVNYMDLGNDTIVFRYGDEFNVQRVVTDADEYSSARKNFGWKDETEGLPLGHHMYVHNEKGIVYLNFDKTSEMFRNLKDINLRPKLEQKIKDSKARAAKLPKGKAKDDLLESIMHAEFRLKHADSFKTEKDLQDFILLHEMFHGKFKKKRGETSIAYERRINNHALKRLNKEKPIRDRKTSQGTLENFRTAMNSGIGNTVLMGTPADKPIAVDGVFYVPMHVAKQFGMKEDAKFKGYARIENGLLSMPFQFLSYSLAAANKITASIAQNQIKNRGIAIAASMGLGYMGMELKYQDWQMDKMSFTDKIARSFDASGVAALYSDLFYTSMGISMALGGPDVGMGLIKPKFKQDKNYLDAITGVAGAGPSYAVDVARGVGTFLSGDYGEGAGQIIRRLPFAQLHFLKDTTNETARAFAGGRY